MSVRREVKDFIRATDLLINGTVNEIPLSETERELLRGYAERLDEKFALGVARRLEESHTMLHDLPKG
jgi:hypothetical protein